MFKCIFVVGNHLFVRISPGPLGVTCWDPSLKLLHPLRRRMSGKWALEKDLSRQPLRVRFFPIYIADLFLGQWLIILVFAGDAEIPPRISGRVDVSIGVETDGQPRRMVPLAGGGFSWTSLKLSTIGVEFVS